MRKIILAGAVAAAAALAIAGGATASASTNTEHFSFIDTSNNPNSNTYSAIATGDFTAGGTATFGSGSHAHAATLRFSNGTIKLKVKAGPPKTRSNFKTCLQTTVDSGTYTLASGTGAYRGITGSGKFNLHFRAVGTSVNGKCSTSTPTTVADQNIITLSGPVSLA